MIHLPFEFYHPNISIGTLWTVCHLEHRLRCKYHWSSKSIGFLVFGRGRVRIVRLEKVGEWKAFFYELLSSFQSRKYLAVTSTGCPTRHWSKMWTKAWFNSHCIEELCIVATKSSPNCYVFVKVFECEKLSYCRMFELWQLPPTQMVPLPCMPLQGDIYK